MVDKGYRIEGWIGRGGYGDEVERERGFEREVERLGERLRERERG